MKKFIITGPKKNHTFEYFDFSSLEIAIKYVIDNAFDFVDFNLFGSKQVFINEQRDDGDFYVAVVINPLTEDVHYQS